MWSWIYYHFVSSLNCRYMFPFFYLSKRKKYWNLFFLLNRKITSENIHVCCRSSHENAALDGATTDRQIITEYWAQHMIWLLITYLVIINLINQVKLFCNATIVSYLIIPSPLLLFFQLLFCYLQIWNMRVILQIIPQTPFSS